MITPSITPLATLSCPSCTEFFKPTSHRQQFCSAICATDKQRKRPRPTLPEVKSRWRRIKDNSIFVISATYTADCGTRIRARLEFSRHYREYTPEAWRKEFVKL